MDQFEIMLLLTDNWLFPVLGNTFIPLVKIFLDALIWLHPAGLQEITWLLWKSLHHRQRFHPCLQSLLKTNPK